MGLLLRLMNVLYTARLKYAKGYVERLEDNRTAGTA